MKITFQKHKQKILMFLNVQRVVAQTLKKYLQCQRLQERLCLDC